MRRRYLTGLADAISAHPLAFIVGGAIVAAVAAVYTALFLEFKTSRNDLIGRDSEYWHLYSEYMREFRSEEDYIVVVESADPARNKEAIDALANALKSPENNPHPSDPRDAQLFRTEDVFYRMNFSAIEDRFLYYLTVDELKEIRDSLKDFKQLVAVLQERPELASFLDAMNQMLQQMETAPERERHRMAAFLPTVTAIVSQLGHPPTETDQSELLSPWASAFFSEDMLSEAQSQLKWGGYNAFRNGQMFILLIHPRGEPNNDGSAPHTATITKLRRIIHEVDAQFPGLKISLTGEPVLDHDEMVESERGARNGTLITLLLIGALFVVGFRELLRPVLGVACLILVVAISLGYATLTVGHLNIITVTFAVMILGLGIDLCIQFIARYEEELHAGAERPQAVRAAIEHTGPSIITAGVTNAAAFFAMGLSGFKGVIELGIIAGGGMLIATAVTMLVLPAFLLLVHRRKESTHIPAVATATKFEKLLLRRPYLMVTLCGISTVVALLVGWQVRFDYNVLNLQSKGLSSVETELRLLEADAQSTIFAAVVCDNLDEARVIQRKLEALPAISSVASVVPLIPENQTEKAEIVRGIQQQLGDVSFKLDESAAVDVQAVVRALTSLRLRAAKLARDATEQQPVDAAVEKPLGSLVETINATRTGLQEVDPAEMSARLARYQRRFFRDLEAQLQLMAKQRVDRPMTIEDLPPEAQRLLVGKTGKLLLRVFPKQNIWERKALVDFVQELRTVAPKATGTPLGIYEFVDILQRGYRNAALWALLVIVVLVFIDFRGGYATLLTILPLVTGILWMVGSMALLGIKFNPANIMVLPLLVGIGVAYGIYIVQRYRETHDAEFYRRSTGRAVVLSALTTIVAFGSLVAGSHRGIQSLGLVMMIGVADCLIAAMVLLPALLEIARRKGWKV